MRTFIASLLVFSSTASADELVLKDGKRIEWTTLKDLGESYEVESKGGVKLEIKKSDIARIEVRSRAVESSEAVKAAATLTGATFTFGKEIKLVQFDLLKSIDTKKDVIRGNWKLSGGTLSGDVKGVGAGWGQLETSYIPPAEYDLTMVLERVDGNDFFVVGLVGDGRQFCFDFGHGGWNGPLVIDGKSVESSGFGIKEDLFPKGKTRRTVQFMVRKYGFAVRVDGKDYITFKGDWSRVTSPGGEYVATKKNVLYFLVGLSTYKISSAMVTFPKE